MINKVINALKNSQNFFESNINDKFSRAIVNDYFEPCSHELKRLKEAIDEAEREGKSIQDMLQQVRAML